MKRGSENLLVKGEVRKSVQLNGQILTHQHFIIYNHLYPVSSSPAQTQGWFPWDSNSLTPQHLQSRNLWLLFWFCLWPMSFYISFFLFPLVGSQSTRTAWSEGPASRIGLFHEGWGPSEEMWHRWSAVDSPEYKRRILNSNILWNSKTRRTQKEKSNNRGEW